MALTAEQILEHVLALPPRERLQLVERVVHETAEDTVATANATDDDGPFAAMSDEEFNAFLSDIQKTRREQPDRAK